MTTNGNGATALTKLGDYLKVAGIVAALAAPAFTFYTVTKIKAAEQDIRLVNAEHRLDKHDELMGKLPEKIIEQGDKLSAKIDAQGEKLSAKIDALVQRGK
jgi:hypothetical protein